MSSIEFREVGVRYGRTHAVRNFSASIRTGEWLGLIGPNGAGKSSLLRATVGIHRHSGDIIVDGSSLTLRSRARRAALIAHV
ncbi:MAG: ATP-binding cassette domain-containing protein, partial [Ilumatobacteraceae bacterium]